MTTILENIVSPEKENRHCSLPKWMHSEQNQASSQHRMFSIIELAGESPDVCPTPESQTGLLSLMKSRSLSPGLST